MKSMTIDEIHKINLQILLHIHEFCKQKGIRYGLAYGSLIGAVRHHGFIPWDDDSDIIMPADDYQRFVKEFPDSADYKLFAPEKGNCWLLYGRVCEMRTTLFKATCPWTKEHPGVGVDVFPMESLSTDRVQHFKTMDDLNTLRKKSFAFRNYKILFPRNVMMTRMGVLRNIGSLIRFVILFPVSAVRWCFISRRLDLFVSSYCEKIKNCTVSYGDHVANIRCPIYFKKEWIPKMWIESFQSIRFEGKELMIPTYYDAMLSHYYGDYMQMPSIEERITHSAFQTMFWRNK